MSSDASSTKSEKKVKHKRSVSDLALHLMHGNRKDILKDEDLQSLVRLCGKSKLYLPAEYSPGSLVLPTCFRATAQYLVQYGTPVPGTNLLKPLADIATGAETRGVFRIPGSARVVNTLYSYYCADGDVDSISSTICCPNLPSHIQASAHDVASTFKRLLFGLPGGILGNLSLFDAFVAIQGQLGGEAEFAKTRQSKLRARMIALAVGTVTSQLRRDLICAVFGLLCLIGRSAETAPREDEHGKPLLTSDLMDYNALGIVFGPLLVGDLLNSYIVDAALTSDLEFPPVPPPNARRERRRSKKLEDSPQQPALAIDKIHLANSITEMLITHWREVVGHMKSLGVLEAGRQSQRGVGLRSSTSGSFRMRMPLSVSDPFNSDESPMPPSPTPESGTSSVFNELGLGIADMRQVGGPHGHPAASLVLPRRRPRGMRPFSSGLADVKLSLLSPPVEEPSPAGLERSTSAVVLEHPPNHYPSASQNRTASRAQQATPERRTLSPAKSSQKAAYSKNGIGVSGDSTIPTFQRRSRAPLVTPKKVSLPQAFEGAASKDVNPFKRRSYKGQVAPDSVYQAQKQAWSPKTSASKASQETSRSTFRWSVGNTTPVETSEKALQDDKPRADAFGLGRSRLSAWRFGWKSHAPTYGGTLVNRSSSLGVFETGATRADDQEDLRPVQQRTVSPSRLNDHRAWGPHDLREGRANRPGTQKEVLTTFDDQLLHQEPSSPFPTPRPNQTLGHLEQLSPLQARSGNVAVQKQSDNSDHNTKKAYIQQDVENRGPVRATPRGPRPNPLQPKICAVPRSTPVESAGNTVKAMAARFESVSRNPLSRRSLETKDSSRTDSKPNGMLSPYTVNPSPVKSSGGLPTPADASSADQHLCLSTIRDRRLRGSGVPMNGEVASERNDLTHGEEVSPETRRSKRANDMDTASETARRLQSPTQTETPRKPCTPNRTSPSMGKRGSPSSAGLPPRGQFDNKQETFAPVTSSPPHEPPPPPPPHSQTPPRLTQTSPSSNPPSTTRRFLLLPTPERGATRPSTPSQCNPTPSPASATTVINNKSNACASGTPGSAAATPSRSDAPNSRDCAPNEPSTKEINLCQDLEGPSSRDEEDAATELARLRERLRETEQACALWRARAERAERRVSVLQGGNGFEAGPAGRS